MISFASNVCFENRTHLKNSKMRGEFAFAFKPQTTIVALIYLSNTDWKMRNIVLNEI